jgi:hypothetical protein
VIPVLRPLSTSELLDRTFHLYRNHFLVFVGITAIPQLFILPLTLGGAALMARHDVSTSALMTLTGYLLFYLAVFISQAPTVAAVSNYHLEKPVSIGSAYSSSKRSLPRVIWIVFLLFLAIFGLVTGLGLGIGAAIGGLAAASGPVAAGIAGVVLIVPATILALRWMLNWSLVIPVTVLEGGWFRASTRRSKTLVKGSRRRVLGVYVLMAIFAGVVTFLIQFLLMLTVGLFAIRDPQTMQAAFQAVQAIGIFIATSVVGALATIALSLIYYDQRVRKEAFDLQVMIANLQPTAPAMAAATNV